MDLNPLDSILDLGKAAIERIWPDPLKRAEEVRKLEELHQQGDMARLDAQVKLLLGQLEVNKAEAQHKSVFVAGWRPWIGWVGGMAMAYQFVIYPPLLWAWAIWGAAGVEPPPVMETGALFSIVTGMLGIGVMRSHDKRAGTQTDSIRSR
ncbi:holin family protein [Microbulbifer celer]|uniref:Holin family protein n=1 Tax=Microbulbifer celer TaxID=435905 RepID=A0ABW3U788_9GAMM|nr:holin family protein [Microbulbifer celer]UFN58574.1 holin family protein [Microbulbifer celer]